MALALILALKPRPEGIAVRFDIGKNRYLRWQLGEQDRVTRNGLPSLASVHERSNLIGPLRPETLGRGEFVIPRQQLNRDQRWLQILSYREADGTGPAVSAIKTLALAETRRREDSHRSEPLPPPAGLALANNRLIQPSPIEPWFTEQRENTMTAVAPAYTQQVDNTAFALKERKLSQPLFLEAIVGALPSLMPMLAPAIGSLISGVAPAVGQVAGNLIRSVGGGGGGGARSDSGSQTSVAQIGTLADQAIRALGPSARQILTPENMRQIMQLIQAGQNATATAPATPPATATTPATQHDPLFLNHILLNLSCSILTRP